MTKSSKQHYVFNFRNPGDDPAITDWSVLFAENKIKSKANNKDLSDIISKAEKPPESSSPKDDTEQVSLNRFFSIVEHILNI
jgi:hypothetical protein